MLTSDDRLTSTTATRSKSPRSAQICQPAPRLSTTTGPCPLPSCSGDTDMSPWNIGATTWLKSRGSWCELPSRHTST